MIKMAKLRMAHASTHGARKPPGQIDLRILPFHSMALFLMQPRRLHLGIVVGSGVGMTKYKDIKKIYWHVRT